MRKQTLFFAFLSMFLYAQNVFAAPVITSVSNVMPLCYGDCNGSITINATGATFYSINGGLTLQASPTFTGLCAGTYNLAATDGVTPATQTFVLNQPTLLVVPISSTPESCFGACDGFAGTAPTGGTPLYAYSWSPSGGSGPFMTGACSGTYTITVTDANGCMVSNNANITSPLAVTITSVTTINCICYGLCDGSMMITASASATGYSINGGLTFSPSNNFTGLCAGTYSVMVEDASGCTASTTAMITSPPIVTASVSTDTTICIGETITLIGTPGGGTGLLFTSWNPPGGTLIGTNYTVSPSIPTMYTFSVTDVMGCGPVSANVTVTVLPPLLVDAGIDVGICEGDCVNLSAIAAGGNGSYSYTWTNNISATVLSGPTHLICPPDTIIYTVTVSDGCGTPSASDMFTVFVNPYPSMSFSVTDETMSAGNGSIDMTATGGTLFDWSNDGTGDFDDTEDLSGLSSGWYYVSVQSPSGCITNDSVFVDNLLSVKVGTNSGILFFPNPFTEYIILNGDLNNVSFIEVIDNSGKIIYSSKAVRQLYLSKLEQGIYLVKCTYVNGDFCYKHLMKL